MQALVFTKNLIPHNLVLKKEDDKLIIKIIDGLGSQAFFPISGTPAIAVCQNKTHCLGWWYEQIIYLYTYWHGDQFNIDFRKISPLSSKIPAITDHKNKVSSFQSGAILIYLAELSGKFYEVENRNLIR